ncbi:MAG TPA: tRNA adenosine(34) deaminase TadA [Pseudomonadales bacterium]
MDDTHWMSEALALADQAAACGEVPVGAVVVRDGEIIGRGFNRPIAACDPTAHAEIEALRDAAARVGNYRLPGAVLYVTVEPCSMCAGAIVHSRIERLVYGAKEPKAGVAESRMRFFDSDFLNHRVIVTGGLMAAQAAEKMQLFFRQRRQR